MRVTEQLLQDNQKQKNKQRQQIGEDEEETMTYMPYPIEQEPLNRQSGVFTKPETSFHTQESVFDRTAIFDTRANS